MTTSFSPKGSLLISALAIAISSAYSHAETFTEHVQVIGQAASIEKSLQQQRQADEIKSTVSADDMAKLPDANVAEAVQRLPGVSVERDQGEGRFVSVRGLGPDMNSVQINGTSIPSPNADTRAVALDVVPSELVQTLSVIKSLTPDMDANSLGGSVEVKSLSAFDHKGPFASATVSGSYDEHSAKTSPQLSLAGSQFWTLNNGMKFGAAAALDWQKRDFASDNAETGGKWDFESGAALEETEMRAYEISRERLGAGLNLDLVINPQHRLYLRSLLSRFTDTETRNAAGVEFADPQAAGVRGDAEGFRELKEREETQQIKSLVLGSEHFLGAWTLNAQAAISESREDTPWHIDGAVFEGNDDFTNIGFDSSRIPVIKADSDFYSGAAFSLSEVEHARQETTDNEKNIKLDAQREYNLAGFDASVKFGAKISRREKNNDSEVEVYEDFGDAGFTDGQLLLNEFLAGNPDYALGKFGPGISASAIKNIIAQLDAADYYDEEESRIADVKLEENINAVYAMNSMDIGRLKVLLGARLEQTRFQADGTGIRDGEFEKSHAEHNYQHLLPGLHLRYQLNDDTQLRTAWTNSVVRPGFEQLSPGFVIDGDEAAFGNPELDALTAANLDVGIEHYFAKGSAISLFAFYKDINNFVYNLDLAGSGEWVNFAEANTYANGDKAELWGAEFSYVQKFSNGFISGANLTLSDSSADIGNAHNLRLPYQSGRVANLMLGWENDVLSLRMSGNYKSEYLQEIGEQNLWAGAQRYLDISARYQVQKNLQLTFEGSNLNNEHYYVYSKSSDYNAQYEEYGPAYSLSLTFTHL